MNLYEYRAVVYKTLLLDGKITFSDNRSNIGTISLPLDSRCITGHVLGDSEEQAKRNAHKRLTVAYPEELGYKISESMRVMHVEEEVVES